MACSGPSGEFLLGTATVLAIQIAKERTAEDLQLLAAFFTVLGDQLALLSLKAPKGGTDTSPKQANSI